MRQTALATATALAAALFVAPVVSLPVLASPVTPEVASLPLSTARAQLLPDPLLPGEPSQEVSTVVDGSTDDFDLVAVTWELDGSVPPPAVEVRVQEAGGWSEWVVLEALDEGPDPGTEEFANSRGGTSPLLTDGADGVEVRLVAAAGETPADARVELVDAGTSAADTALEQAPLTGATAAAGRPSIISRASWGADESLRGSSVNYMDSVDVAVIHHTASTNKYTDSSAAQQIRSVYAYHTASLGWSDIGYNFLVDKYGRIYEGRAGGMDRAVQGAHSGGFNKQTVGISGLGDYQAASAPAAMVDSIARLIAWKLPLHGSDPSGSTTLTSAGGGTAKYPQGREVTVRNVIGHRDVGLTACPGINLYNQVKTIRDRADSLAGEVAVGAGNFESALGGYQSVQVAGWALRVGDATARTVTVAVDGADRGTVRADRPRADVQSLYPSNSATHGFAGQVAASPGMVKVCPRVEESSVRFAMACRTALVQGPSPVGALSAAVSEFGRVTVSGWAVDGDTTDPVDVHVYADGVGLGTGLANRADASVATLLPGRKPGFSFSLPMAGTGTRSVCAYAINRAGSGGSTLLGCRSVAVDPQPRGVLESAVAVGGEIRLSGWLVDPDTKSSPVHVYVDGVGTALRTDTVRSDVAAAHPAFATFQHGWTAGIPASTGAHQVCAYGINTGPGGNIALGCRTVTVQSGSPFGSFESLTAVAGTLELSGWVVDPDVPVTDVHVYVDGVGTRLRTTTSRADVAAAHPAYASWSHAWSATMKASPGTHQVCAYGINSGRGSTTVLGCRSVTVRSGSPVGSFEAATAVGGTISFSGWAADPDVLTSDVHVYVDGVGQRLTTTAPRADVARFFPDYARHTPGWSGQVTAKAGTRNVCAYAINSGPGANVLLGCKSVVVRTGSPFGSLEAVSSPSTGTVDVSGWIIDPDSTSSAVHVYVDKVGTATRSTTTRADVARAFPAYASYQHGWSTRVSAPSGTRQVCVYGINTGTGGTLAMGCRQVTVR